MYLVSLYEGQIVAGAIEDHSSGTPGDHNLRWMSTIAATTNDRAVGMSSVTSRQYDSQVQRSMRKHTGYSTVLERGTLNEASTLMSVSVSVCENTEHAQSACAIEYRRRHRVIC